MKKNRPPETVAALEIVDTSTEGKAIAKHEGLVVFVEGAVPGDVADVTIFRKKKNLAEGRVAKLIQPSPYRAVPVCEHFGVCGGCKWQHMQYERQLYYKQKQVQDAFERIGKFPAPAMMPIVRNDAPYYYRNKLEYTFSAKRWLTPLEMQDTQKTSSPGLGYHLAGMFDKILDIRDCYLQPEPSNSIRNAVRQYALEHNLSFFDIKKQQGFLRTLMIRTSSLGEVMIVVTVFEWDEPALMALLSFLRDAFPAITSLQYAHNPKGNDTLAGLDIRTFHGKDYITEALADLKYRISARSFYQTNSAQAAALYSIALEFAGLTGKELVYDLYTGTGTIANFLAAKAAKVIGIEYVEDAVADARVNATENGITNTEFFAGDMQKILTAGFFEQHGAPDVIVTDPPRAGMHEDVVKAMLAAAPPRIVYVSCNPASQARDIALMANDYHVSRVQPVDMFPQTSHVENVTLLERRKEIPKG